MSLMKTPKSYLAEIVMRRKICLLVEGKDDKQLFEKLIDRLLCFHTGSSHSIQVDSVEIFDVPGETGNRGKVKAVCSFMLNSKVLRDAGIKFAGFVDREFDGFDLNKLQDLLKKHHVEGYLVWSRGHSIENYFFEPSLFKELFWEILNANWASQALAKFEVIFDETIRLACAIGLATYELKRINLIRENICPEILKINNEKMSIDFEKWKSRLIKKGLSSSDLEELEEKYSLYYSKLADTDLVTVKQLCHGHLGFELIIFACCCCVEEIYLNVSNSEQTLLKTLIGKVRGVKKSKFDQCATWWARKVENQECEYPEEIFQLLGIANEDEDVALRGESNDIKLI